MFLISPDSAASPECARELEHAEALSKRVIGVLVRAIDPQDLPESLSAREFVPRRGQFEDDFERSLQLLVNAIETDLEWVKAHTQWGRKALEWEAHEHDPSFLLSGSELEEAEQWVARQAGKQPTPTELQATYVLRSRQRATRRLRVTRAAVSVALIVAIVLSVVALVERATAVANQKVAQSRELAASAESTLESDPGLSTQLALRGLQLSPTAQAQAALRDALPQVQLLGTLEPSAPLQSPNFSPDGSLVLTASTDGAAEIWDAHTGKLRQELISPSGTGLEQALFSPDGSKVVTASDQGTARIWDVSTGGELGVLSEPGGGGINGASFSPDGKLIVTAGSDGRAIVWNAVSDTPIGQPLSTPSDPASIYTVAFGPDGKLIATSGSDGVTRVWSWDSGPDPRILRTFRDPDQLGIYTVQFSPDGTELATSSADGVARVWDVASGKLLLGLVEPHEAAVYGAAFSSDSTRILTASYDGTARIWDARTGSLVRVIREPARGAGGCILSADGSRIVTASLDGTARVWDARSGRQLTLIRESAGSPVEQASFSPDGKLIGTASLDGTARIWDSATGQQLTEFDAGGALIDIAFSPDGRSAITSGAAATIWSTELASPLATIEQLARQRVPPGFSAAEIATYLQGIGP